MKLEPSEAQFQESVVRLATLAGWRTMHVRRSVERGNQWRTTTSINGWPDLVLWRSGAILFVELKSETGRLSRQQRDVLESLAEAGQDVRIWRPSDWPEIEMTLTARSKDRTSPTPVTSELTER